MDLGGINNKLKKFIFYIILIAITFSFIEFGSWSTIKVYQLIKHPKKNTDIQYEITHIIDGQPILTNITLFMGGKKKILPQKILM